jgi:hypothetical protein
MAEYPESLDHMLAAWNERNLDRIRGHLEKALAANVLFCDPRSLVSGLDEFESMVREFRASIPDAVCARTTGFDTHHNRYRYEWSVSSGGQVVVPGFDVAFVNAEGKVERIEGFFGPLPALDG